MALSILGSDIHRILQDRVKAQRAELEKENRSNAMKWAKARAEDLRLQAQSTPFNETIVIIGFKPKKPDETLPEGIDFARQDPLMGVFECLCVAELEAVLGLRNKEIRTIPAKPGINADRGGAEREIRTTLPDLLNLLYKAALIGT